MKESLWVIVADGAWRGVVGGILGYLAISTLAARRRERKVDRKIMLVMSEIEGAIAEILKKEKGK